ncbi:tRNA modification GTPase MnmE [Serratia quinivorans]|uniref:tRNA modification GTPase MnmE n=1 Tax=Serratia quinivorans TaxID=137545 RepID=A0A379ZG24_9GAMM|nr:tRNA modification GTPase MnmE [Serratia quinivorans]
MSTTDTIVAQATPPGRGGVGILRISGRGAKDVAQALLGKLPKPRYADYLPFRDAAGAPPGSGHRTVVPRP